MVKMLTGLIAPTSGDALIGGLHVAGEPLAVRRVVGVLPENLGLFDSLTIEEHLHLSGPVYGLSAGETHQRTNQLLRVLGLEDGRDTFASECSHGMRKKTALAMALLHNPQALFLDEPFEGIDPVAAKTIGDLLQNLARRGMTVFLTSHILSIVEKLATQIVLIRGGKIVWNSAAEHLERPVEDLYFDLVEAPPNEEMPWLGCAQS